MGMGGLRLITSVCVYNQKCACIRSTCAFERGSTVHYIIAFYSSINSIPTKTQMQTRTRQHLLSLTQQVRKYEKITSYILVNTNQFININLSKHKVNIDMWSHAVYYYGSHHKVPTQMLLLCHYDNLQPTSTHQWSSSLYPVSLFTAGGHLLISVASSSRLDGYKITLLWRCSLLSLLSDGGGFKISDFPLPYYY